jgi:DNA-binding FadR family transcriptional regulator
MAQTDAPSQRQLDLEAAKANRKALVGEAMALTPQEAKGFWPLYDQYEAKMDALEVRHANEVRAFAKAFQNLTDQDAKAKLDEVVAIAQARLDAQKEFIPKFRAVLSQIKTTRFFQIDNKLHALVQCDIAKMVPLAGDAGARPASQ